MNSYFMQSTPQGINDVIGLPLLLFALGLGIWYVGLRVEKRTDKTWLKRCALIPLAIGAYHGLQLTLAARDSVYQLTLPNRKTLFMHYLALVLPVMAIGVILLWHRYLKRSGAYDR